MAAGTAANDRLVRAMSAAAYGLDPGRGLARVYASEVGAVRPDPEPAPTPEDVARLLAAVEPGALDEQVLLVALTRAVDFARYWQEPDGEDVLAATAVDAARPCGTSPPRSRRPT